MPPEENIDLSGIPDAPDPGVDLSAIPDADLQNSQSEAKSMMGEAWKTSQEIGNVYPMAEAAASFITGIAGGSIAGLGGLFALPFVGSEGATGVIETINKWLVYQPQTKAGTHLSDAAMYPLKKLEQAGSALSDEVMNGTGNPYLATAVYTAIVGAPALIGLRGLPKALRGKIEASTTWRKMTVKERGLVLQGLEDTIRKNPEMTEGELVRKYDVFRKDAMAKRAEGEKVTPVKKVEKVKAGVEAGIKEPWEMTYKKGMKDTHIVEAIDKDGNVIGRGRFVDKGENIKYEPGGILYVEPDFRRKGVATAIFRKIEAETGKKLLPGRVTTGEGKAFQDTYFKPEKKPATVKKVEEAAPVLNELNPTSGVFADYAPDVIAKMKLGENITTLDKTMGKPPDEMITIYRGAKGQTEIVPGDFVTTNRQLAKDYAGTGDVIERKVRLSDVLDDKTEPLGEEYIYRPQPKPPPETEAEKFNREVAEIVREETDLTDAEIDQVFLGGEKAVEKPKSSRAIRTVDLPESLSRTFAMGNVSQIKGRKGTSEAEDYQQGKYEGSVDAADRVVLRMLNDKKLSELRKNLDPDKPILFIPVVNSEAAGKLNALPLRYAKGLAAVFNGEVYGDIVKVVGKPSTGVSLKDRISKKILFEGDLPRGNFQVVVVGDTFTSGRTSLSLVEHLQALGADVVAVTTMAFSARSGAQIKPTKKQLDKIREYAKMDTESQGKDIDAYIREVTGHDIEQFTGAEATAIRKKQGQSSESFRSLYPAEAIAGDISERLPATSIKSQVALALDPPFSLELPTSIDFKDHIEHYIGYLSSLVRAGEAGKRVRVTDLDGTEQWIGVASTYPDFMRDQGLTGKRVKTALDKALAGKKLTPIQEGIVRNALEQAQEMFLQEFDQLSEAEFQAASKSIDAAVEQFFKDPAKLKGIEGKTLTERRAEITKLTKATKAHLAKIRKALKPRKAKDVKRTVREATGQTKISKIIKGLTERTALADQIRFEARAARDAYRAGKLDETIKHKNKAISLYRRRERLRAIRDYLVIPENIMKKLTKGRDIGLMSNWEFKQYKDDLLVKALEMTEQLEAKNRLLKLIADKRLQRVDNYRKALELPPIGKMTLKEIEDFEALLEPFADEDVFLTERELDTVDRTDLAGIRTWREARLALAKEVGATIEQIEAIKVHELDDYRYDTALAEQNPFYRMLVTESARKLMEADARYYDIEKEALSLAKKAEKSRARTLIERAIPQDKKIMEYMEASAEFKPALAGELTGAQLDYTHFMESYFSEALEYLIKTQALTKGRENYFVHMRRTFLEEVKESGLKKAFLSLYKNYKQDEAVFNILDEDTGNILPMEKFFQFALHRSGELLPTANITRAFTSYVKMFERKRSYDELIPKMDIYAQSLTPQVFTPRGLEIDRSIKKFVNKYINNKKGRRIRWIGKQNGVIDLTIRAARTFTTMLDLGLNIPVSIASVIGEQATTLQGVGLKKYTLGVKRLQTDQGKKIVKENIAFVGKSVFAELAEPGKLVTERFMEGLFSLFRIATVTANKQFLLGSLTKEEFETGKISSKRLAELRVDMGRWRKVTGAESLVGGTGAGGAAVQYKTWAVPILSTTLRDLKIFSKDMKAKGLNEALTSKEAKELWRFLLIGCFVAIVGTMIAAEKDDRSLIGQIKAKAYRELNTLMQGIGPGLWLSVPRIMVFAKQLGANLQDIMTLERYKTKRGLKGVEGLKRQLTPQVVRQVTREKKGKRKR